MKAIKNIKIIVIALLVILLIILVVFSFDKFKKEETEQGMVSSSPVAGEQVYLAGGKVDIEEVDRLIGDKGATVKIFVYEDNSNIYSAQLAETMDRLYSENQGQVALVIRPFVAKTNLLSRDTALTIECASDQGKWLEMRKLLFDRVKSDSLNLTDFSEYSQEVGLDEEAFGACLTSPEKYAKIDELAAQADAYGVIGAPTIFIGEEMIPGARPYDDYTDANGEKVDGLKTLLGKRLAK